MALRSLYLVSYDVTCDKRRRLIYKTLLGFGDRIQFSVFLCSLTTSSLVRLKSRLRFAMHELEDRIVFANLGPSEGRANAAISSLGRPPEPPDEGPVIV